MVALNCKNRGLSPAIPAIIFFVSMMLGGEAVAATCTSDQSGNWNNSSTWSCNKTPGSGDIVIIQSPHSVDLNGNARSAASLTIDEGGTLDDDGENLTVSGNVVINGTYDGSGTNGDLFMTGDGTTLSGTGTIIDIGHIYIDADVTIPAGSDLNLTQDAQIRVGDNAAATLTIDGIITGTSQDNGNRILRLDNNNTSNVILNGTINAPNSYVEIQSGGTFTNNGTVILQHLDGDGAATATWTQGANSSLTLSEPTQSWSGTFNASANGNTVTWTAPATPLTPSGNTYYNLAGSGVPCPHGFTVLGSDFSCTPPSGSTTVTASPTLCVDDTGIGSRTWVTLTGPHTSDNAYASVQVDDGETSHYLKCTGYGFSIPSNATILGIIVGVERLASNTNLEDAAMRIVKWGAIGALSNDRSNAGNYPTSDPGTTDNHGGYTDLWGDTWTPADIEAANFGAAFATHKSSGSGSNRTVWVDHMPITVTYTVPAFPTVSSINRADANPTPPGSAVSWTVTFSASVIGVDSADFVLAATGVTGASISGVSGSGTTWTVTANTGSGTGTLGLNLVDDDSIVDGGGLKLGDTGAGNGNFTGEVYTVAVPSLSGVINTYYFGTTASVAAGATSIVLGAAIGSTTPISIGDTLIIMQMQDASINSANSDAYGDGVGGDSVGRGTTSVGGSGLYEYAIAASNVPVGGGTLTLACGTTNAYANAAATGASGQKKYQVIRVPMYDSALLSSTLTASAWNGSAGGVLAFDVTGDLAFGSSSVDVGGKGFRGGGGRDLTGGSGSDTDYMKLATNAANGSKGEGIAGTPRYVFFSTLIDTGVEGYPNGSYARGAPGNAGGGATDGDPAGNANNSGGGGGSNWGIGGYGGNYWSETTYREGGVGGANYSGVISSSRLFMGGGGGAGSINNNSDLNNGLYSSGTAGGGIVMIRAGSTSGSATISVNGADADQTHIGNDGSGGGGAGGAVLFYSGAGSLAGLTVNANGGRGGSNRPNALNGSSNEHGAGGGGSGGFIVVSGASLTGSSVSGGLAGTSDRSNGAPAHRATDGGAGSITYNLNAAQIPGTVLGASACGATIDHYLIGHSGTGLTCEAEPVTFTAHDSVHARVDANGKTLSITTDTSSGTWLASADSCSQTCYNTSGTAAACAGSFTGSSGNNGQASYVFASGESGIRLCLKQNSAVTQNINASDGTVSEATGTAGAEGGAGADPNLVFGNTGIRIYADGNVDTIGSQIAGVSNDDDTNHPATQVLTVRALKSGETTPARCVPLLASVTRTLQFAYRCESSPSTCSASLSQGLQVNGTAVTGFDASDTPVPNNDVSVGFDANGYGSINLKYFDVGNISLWARATSLADSTTGSTFAVVAGNSNTFAVKPYDFEVIPCAASVVGACTVEPADPGLAGGGSVFAKAGEIFKTTVTARALGGTKTYSFGRCDDSGGTGCAAASEVVTLSRSLAAPGGGNSGSPLGGTTTPAASDFVADAGSHTFTDLNWDEVGVNTLKAANANYLSNGLGICTTQTAGETCQGAFGVSGNLGRFVPDHFDVELVSASGVPMSCPTGLTCQTNLLGESGFAYSGQPFSVKVTARNAAGSTTTNYDGSLGFSKVVTLSAWDALGGIATQNPGAGTPANFSVAAARFGSGVATADPLLLPTYSLAAPTAPTDIYVRATDTDSVSSRRASAPGASVEPGLKVVNGRVKIGNAHGSELLPLPMTAKVEYYNGTFWTTSVTDSVTSLTLAATYNVVGATTGTTTPTPTGAANLTNGLLNFTLSKPTGGAGSATINPTAPAWLPLTSGLATYGVYKGNNEFIYLRENY